MLGLHPQYQHVALERVPEAFRDYFRHELSRPKTCTGMDGERCTFGSGGGAVRVHCRAGRCLFCTPEVLWPMCEDDGERQQVLAKLRRMPAQARGRVLEERLLPEAAEYFRAQLALPAARGPAVAQWSALLASRLPPYAPASAAVKQRYREAVLTDRARARRRMQQPPTRVARGEDVENTTGLPPAKSRRLAADFERWCFKDAWSMCSTCGALAPRELTESSLRRSPKPTHAPGACFRCRGTRSQPSLALEDVPAPLRGLSKEAAQALSPLEIDVGPVIRAEGRSGYRQHATMMRFRWQTLSVSKQIKKVEDPQMRQKARAAYKYLCSSDKTPYADFVAEHKEFLQQHPGADLLTRRRRLQFLERTGLECALWPCLFWDVKMTFTHERGSDPRRVLQQQRQPTLEEVVLHGRRPLADAHAGADDGARSSDQDEEAPDEIDEDSSRHSVKRLFAALAMGRLLGYGAEFELLQFAYDLNLWSSLGSKRNLQLEVPMRVMMKGEAFSPLYWRAVHYALLDMVRQVGYPRIFLTLAPYEWSFPYHEWLRDEMSKMLKERLFLPVGETLHIVHVLVQALKGLVLGQTGGKRHRRPWKSNLFRVLDESGQPRRLHFFLRLEYQDGTRKAPTQDYHGSGRVHVHIIIFARPEDLPQLPVAEAVSATLPEDPDLRGYVEGSQYDRDGKSGWPVREEASCYDRELGAWRLKHSENDHRAGLRPYLLDLMEALRCHQDFQMCNDDGLLRAYVTKYVSKFSDAASDEWLNDSVDAVGIAATVLMRYKPLEPEMVLQLFGARFRQWHLSTESGGKRDFVVPCPDQEPKPREVELYEAAPWARGRISLLDFLRKTTADGKICHWLKKRHVSSGSAQTLEDFAASYRMQGEKVVAAETVSKFNDRFFGQWLMLHVPFRSAADLALPEAVADRVPEAHRYFGMALLCKHPIAQAMWRDDERIRQEFKMEAHTQDHVDTLVAMIQAHRGLVHKYLQGNLDARAERRQRQEQQRRHQPGAVAAAESPDFNQDQQRFRRRVNEAVDRALQIEASRTEAEADRLREEAASSRATVCLGPPGTGKTTVVFSCIDRALEEGGRVLLALPTAQLASRMRAKYGDAVDIDTCHAAFGLHETAEQGEASLLAIYALIVVDELSQLDEANFEKILRIWGAAERIPALALLGDRWQMAGMGERRPWHSRLWPTMCFRVTLHTMYRCKDPKHARLLKLLRTGKPTKKLLDSELRKKMAWRPAGPPTVDGVRKLLKAHPDTTILTCSRRGAEEVNQCALKALFPTFPPLIVLPADVDSNPENYVRGVLKPVEELVPSNMPVHRGMRVYMTRNVRKDLDYVNGMEAQVLDFDRSSAGLLLRTVTGHTVSVWRWTDPDRGGLSYYPVRPGYASTILKFQGAELPHVVVYLDAPKVPAAAYTAISRVGFYDNFLLAGSLTPEHFTPAH